MKKHITSTLSQLFGKFASKPFSRPVQGWINRTYVRLMKLDMSEFNEPESYPTLNALFTRELQKPRSFDQDSKTMISPCDALITEGGSLEHFDALQIKGMAYDVRAFITDAIDEKNAAWLEDGSYVNFYLSPTDYHRYHVPLDMKVTKAVYVPGKLYPVNIPSLKKRLNLFIENERVVLECQSQNTTFFLVLVGALNVGQMVVNFEPDIQTNANKMERKVYTYDNVELKKGDELGFFKMGSTVILLAPKEMLDIQVKEGDKVSFAQTIATLKR